MTVETGNTIANLKPGWPLKSHPKSQGDDHIRVIKHILQTQFPDGVGGSGFKIPLTATTQQLNWLSNVSADVQGQINHINGVIGTTGLEGQIAYNNQLIIANQVAIGVNKGNITSSAAAIATNTAAIATNTAELAAFDLAALETQVATNKTGVKTNKDAITKLNTGPHLHVAGMFDGTTLNKLAGSDYSVERAPLVSGEPGYPGVHAKGYYLITMNTASIGHYVVNATAGAVTGAVTVNTSQFTIAAIDTTGAFVDPNEVHFMVVDV